jgi:hypothetical protein
VPTGIRLDQPEKSEVAKHSINTGKHIDFINICVFDMAPGYMDSLHKEAMRTSTEMLALH